MTGQAALRLGETVTGRERTVSGKEEVLEGSWPKPEELAARRAL